LARLRELDCDLRADVEAVVAGGAVENREPGGSDSGERALRDLEVEERVEVRGIDGGQLFDRALDLGLAVADTRHRLDRGNLRQLLLRADRDPALAEPS